MLPVPRPGGFQGCHHPALPAAAVSVLRIHESRAGAGYADPASGFRLPGGWEIAFHRGSAAGRREHYDRTGPGEGCQGAHRLSAGEDDGGSL